MDGALYVSYSAPWISPSNAGLWESDNFVTLKDGKGYYEDDWDENGDPIYQEITALRIGTPEEYISVWEQGEELPLCDAETDSWYAWYYR
jgi:hypothetical protein